MTEKIRETTASAKSNVRAALKKVQTGFAWRWQRFYNKNLFRAAAWQRNRVRGPIFVAVTGSVGKTTAKELIAQLLTHSLGPGKKTLDSLNYPEDLARILFGTRDSDAFCVAEISAHAGPGGLDFPLALLKPSVGVVTAVGSDHHSAYGDVAAITKEKSKVIQCLPPDGIAVLNYDDANVMSMGKDFPGSIVTFGTTSGAMVHASSIRSAWPGRLSLTVSYGGESVPLQTRFCGTHWVPSILAAIATGISLGIPLAKAADALADAQPFNGRMEPVEADGITFILDDWKSALPSVEPAFDVIRTATAKRKIIVVGNISDYPGSDRRYAQIAKSAIDIADCVVFVGQFASVALRAKRKPSDHLYSFATALDAHNFLKSYLQAGDLVLLKGNIRTDHLRRLYLARKTNVACWRMDCRRADFCDACELMGVPSASPSTLSGTELVVPSPQASLPPAKLDATVVIGLGNPHARLVHTPHNVGYLSVEGMADTMQAQWTAEDDIALVTRGEIEGQALILVKPLCEMNDSGPTIAKLANRFGFGINQCIVVHDDLGLPLGTVRARERGSDGGHNGVKSILHIFQTDQVRRIKIGVGKPSEGKSVSEHVLTPFAETDLPKIEQATKLAEERTLELIRKQIREAVSP